jgi:membrane-associated phospholipid phosphatase
VIARAAKTSLGLSLLFLVVYGACNRFTSLRSDVGVFYWPFERTIPYLPLMIIPYMSIDLFFVVAPFLCRTRRELRTLAARIGAAIVLAGAGFLLLPMRFAFERPESTGILGLIFNRFRTLDLPYNEFPSLHIALCLILAGVYGRHTRGWVRAILMGWFGLIFISVVFTYQHHAIDILGGAALALVCLALFREDQALVRPAPNVRVGIYYALAAALLVAFACLLRPVGLLILSPAAPLGILAAWYLGAGAGAYDKRHGRLGLLTHVIFWPVLLGQRMSLLWYARRSAAWNVLSEQVWIGRHLTVEESCRAIAGGVRAVVDVANEFAEPGPLVGMRYLSLPVLDLTAPTITQLRAAAEFIDQEAAGGIVYIHCKAGYSRTAAVAGAWLMHSGRAGSAAEAMETLRRVRPGMIIRSEVARALEEFEKTVVPMAVSV